jgi:hypothetical protein
LRTFLDTIHDFSALNLPDIKIVSVFDSLDLSLYTKKSLPAMVIFYHNPGSDGAFVYSLENPARPGFSGYFILTGRTGEVVCL